jgi:DnaK suppressor protein
MKPQAVKKLLLAKQHELSSRHISQEDIAIEKNAEVLDEIQRNADRTLALQSLTHIWETESLVSEALQRIEDGSYGTCAECDAQISEKRLAAIPWAKYCIQCQEVMDRSAEDTSFAEAA